MPRDPCALILLKHIREEAHYLSKLNDLGTENAETQVWLDLANACSYFIEGEYEELREDNDEVGKLVIYIINNSEKFIS
jgi:four helix bundle protein